MGAAGLFEAWLHREEGKISRGEEKGVRKRRRWSYIQVVNMAFLLK
jgi:hypothetical protein